MAEKNFFSNADLFNKLPPSYYLRRSNQIGTQTISTIEGLQEALDACTGIFATLAYVNSQDVATLFAAQNYADSQDLILRNYVIQQDASLLAYDAKFIKSASLGIGLYWNSGYVNVSDYISKSYIDSSLAYYIKSSSTGVGLYWNAGLLDVSVLGGSGDVTKIYVDGSLFIRDLSINELYSMMTPFDILDGGSNWSIPNINSFNGGMW